jgi:hypothetical protein
MHELTRFFGCRRLRTFAIVTVFVLGVWECPRTIAAPAEGRSDVSTAETVVASPPAKKANVRRQEIHSALLMWCGIMLAGLLLLSIVIVGGRQLRRLMRRRPISPTAVDPFWYLKIKKPSEMIPADRHDPGPDTSGNEKGGHDRSGGRNGRGQPPP